MQAFVEELKAKGTQFPIAVELDGSSTHKDVAFYRFCKENQM